jgi:sterol 14-demethylase
VSGGLPVLGHIAEFLRNPISVVERGQREHGRIFGWHLAGRPMVALLGPEYHRFFFAETDRRLSIRAAYPFFVRMFDRDFYLFAEFEEYQRQRELVLPRFRGKSLDSYVAVMAAETDRLIDELGDSGEFDLVDRLGPLVMHIAADAFLGPDISVRMRGFFEEFRRFSAGMDPVLPGWLPLPHLVRSRRSRDRLRTVIQALISERRRQPEEPADFLQLLCGARFSDGEPVPDLVLVNLILMITWAGHETTTGHLSWAIIDLLRNPEELAKVRAEQGEIASDGPLTTKLAHRMARLDRALHETERLHPVAFVLARHAAESFELDGYLIEKGSMILTVPQLAHRLPDQYPDPDAYRPDRYLDDPRAMQQLIGFGGGTHRCLGVHFAYLEMKVILSILLRRYDLELVDPDPQPISGNRTKWPQSPCRVRYRLRQTSDLGDKVLL